MSERNQIRKEARSVNQTGGRAKAGKASAGGPASPPFAEFFCATGFLPEKQEKERTTQLELFQAIENAADFQQTPEKSAISEPFFPVTLRQRTCVICSAVFELPPRSTATSCSEECRCIRRQRYGAAYRQHGREVKAKLLAMFGGRRPTDAELLKMIQQRKAKP